MLDSYWVENILRDPINKFTVRKLFFALQGMEIYWRLVDRKYNRASYRTASESAWIHDFGSYQDINSFINEVDYVRDFKLEQASYLMSFCLNVFDNSDDSDEILSLIKAQNKAFAPIFFYSVYEAVIILFYDLERRRCRRFKCCNYLNPPQRLEDDEELRKIVDSTVVYCTASSGKGHADDDSESNLHLVKYVKFGSGFD
ncbi:hypothetical protein [Oleiphilus sp. HI0086]|uniref:hypothetical protein n=1 Tax=Oleiphilus sp. HI0086 TaxID=1822260 RepID=UPI0007C362A4|nr:hypothetical protein [Oleiphilus sp. HI0086]KZZ34776.1 hypothetical protein A3756_17210 [Oleiphilus sp. HI0086]